MVFHYKALSKTLSLLYLFTFFCLFKLYSFQVPLEERPEYFFADLLNVLKDLGNNSPVLLDKEFDLEIAVANHLEAKSEQGFRVGVNVFGHSIHEDRPNEDFTHRFRTLNQIYLRKPVYHWGALRAREEIGSLNKQWTDRSLSYRKRSLSSELRAIFLELVILNYRSQVAAEQIKIAQGNLKSAQDKLNVGMVTPLLLDEVKAELLNREISLSEIKILLKRKLSTFVSLSGHSNSLNLSISEKFWDFASTHEPDTNFPVIVGAINSAEIENLNTQIFIENQRIIISDAELKPKINLVGSYFQDQIDTAKSGDSVDRNNFLVGIEGNWAIWDSRKSLAQKKASLARKAKLEHSINTKTRALRDHMNTIVTELKSLKERIILGRKMVSVSQSRLDKSKLELELNRISPMDHFNSVVAFDLAKISNLEAVCNYMVLLNQYENLMDSD